MVQSDEKGVKSVAYANIAPVLIEATKQLKDEKDSVFLFIAGPPIFYAGWSFSTVEGVFRPFIAMWLNLKSIWL